MHGCIWSCQRDANHLAKPVHIEGVPMTFNTKAWSFRGLLLCFSLVGLIAFPFLASNQRASAYFLQPSTGPHHQALRKPPSLNPSLHDVRICPSISNSLVNLTLLIQ